MKACSIVGALIAILVTGMFCTQAMSQTCPDSAFPIIAEDEAAVSLGRFRIWVYPQFRHLFDDNGAYDPAYYDDVLGKLTSPLLRDGATKIGTSIKHQHGLATDMITGAAVGFAGTVVKDADFVLQPAGFQGGFDTPTLEVHTEIVAFQLTDLSLPGLELRAGLDFAGPPYFLLPSYGEVESIDGDGIPELEGESFFNINVEVDLPLLGTPDETATLYNSVPLLVTSDQVCPMPPTVVYVHENPAAVPIHFRADHSSDPPNNWYANDQLGFLVLAGHGVMDSSSANWEFLGNLFNQAWDDMQGNEMELPCCNEDRGNVNGQGGIDVSDLGYLVDYLFRGGPPSPCPEAADVNSSGGIDVSDLGYLVDYLFRGGPAPGPC